MLTADLVWPLRDAPSGAFALEDANAAPEQAIVTAVDRPVLLGYAPDRPNGRAMLILGGGGYVALMAGREGVQVAQWLTSLGYHAFVLVHRLPHAGTGPSAPLDDALAAMRMIRASDLAPDGVGVVGLSSGGHLAAAARRHGHRLCAHLDQCQRAHHRRRQAATAAGGKAGALRRASAGRATIGRPAAGLHRLCRQ
jgi:acetyl esterase/lipase